MADAPQTRIIVNKGSHDVDAAPDRPLLEVLREDLHLAGTHYGCGAGQCGACGVLIDGRREFSCQLPLSAVGEKPVTTIEGLANGEKLHVVQQVFLDEGGFQCGYCTPGMIVAVIGFLNENPAADDESLLKAMDTNLCRCCGYTKIAGVIRKAAAAVRGAT